MLLIWAILFIEPEAITEGILKRFNKAEWLFYNLVQWIVAIALSALWFFVVALPFDKYYVPIEKLIIGFVFVRFAIFDISINLAWGMPWNYYGKKKWYDRTMTKLGGFGWFLKIICGIMGICFLLGYS